MRPSGGASRQPFPQLVVPNDHFGAVGVATSNLLPGDGKSDQTIVGQLTEK